MIQAIMLFFFKYSRKCSPSFRDRCNSVLPSLSRFILSRGYHLANVVYSLSFLSHFPDISVIISRHSEFLRHHLLIFLVRNFNPRSSKYRPGTKCPLLRSFLHSGRHYGGLLCWQCTRKQGELGRPDDSERACRV